MRLYSRSKPGVTHPSKTQSKTHCNQHENVAFDRIRTGFVRRTNYVRTKGFGFVTVEPDEGDEDIFFHVKGEGNEVKNLTCTRPQLQSSTKTLPSLLTHGHGHRPPDLLPAPPQRAADLVEAQRVRFVLSTGRDGRPIALHVSPLDCSPAEQVRPRHQEKGQDTNS